jgi:hypothetical protein
MKELKERTSRELLLDHRGDLDKILLAIDKGIKSIDDDRKKIYSGKQIEIIWFKFINMIGN